MAKKNNLLNKNLKLVKPVKKNILMSF